jgi:hypothetical protein
VSWLHGDDPELIAAALAVNEGFLFKTREDMEEAFTALTRRFPQFAAVTQEIMDKWDAKFKVRAIEDAINGTRPISSVAGSRSTGKPIPDASCRR